MMFSIANEKLKEAAMEAEKGNERKAKWMAQEAQQTVHAFVAPQTGASGGKGGKSEVLVDEGSKSQCAINVSSSDSGGVEEKGGVVGKQERAEND
ncbi:hypothetical protein BLNAU_2059 [Blattamonas nauphoetae]|uniref:Uncharacterized protein n=1 Tax=Blattamonas nauphoetae TaxID=2049346 RepID=A0ABQ9YH97_9EUKA|nr:hypothetical protein BLNAU_2059 [Blattamonas nauphoetae]